MWLWFALEMVSSFCVLVGHCMSSLDKCLFRSSAHFSDCWFFLLHCISFLCILDIKPLSDGSFLNSCYRHYGLPTQQNSLIPTFLKGPEFCPVNHLTLLQGKLLRGCYPTLQLWKRKPDWSKCNPITPVSDWFKNGHVTQVWPMRQEESFLVAVTD